MPNSIQQRFGLCSSTARTVSPPAYHQHISSSGTSSNRTRCFLAMSESAAAPQQPAAYRLVAADELGLLKGESGATLWQQHVTPAPYRYPNDCRH